MNNRRTKWMSLCGLRKQSKFRDATTDSSRNDVWQTSEEIPYWWRVPTQIWAVLLIGWSKFPSWYDQSEALTQIRVVKRHQYGISALVSQRSFRGKPAGVAAKCRLFSHASHYVNSLISLPCSESPQLVSSRCCTWRCHNFAPRTEFLKTDDWPADYLFKRILLALYFRFTIFVAVDLPSS